MVDLSVSCGGSSPRGRGKPDFQRFLSHGQQAHPRAGGENLGSTNLPRLGNGSSPRGRGKREFKRDEPVRVGLIPARAGKTSGPRVVLSASWAHPRAGGENLPTSRTGTGSCGSSPRGRGKREVRGRSRPLRRLIPARAGKTQWRAANRSIVRAHPRAGGENCYNTSGNRGVTGSSPRGRGKPIPHLLDGSNVGLIPARAGKTSAHSRMSRPSRAHPRAGGENTTQNVPFLLSMGSSPRGRGKHRVPPRMRLRRRLIPARAGNTYLQAPGSCGSRAHPRAGGENHAVGGQRVGHTGLIPARAGKTPGPRCTCRPHAAHPRAGGENIVGWFGRGRFWGSSPRGRGKRRAVPVRSLHVGLIPARAGKTNFLRRAS